MSTGEGGTLQLKRIAIVLGIALLASGGTSSLARQLGDIAGEGGPADGQVNNIDALFAAQVVEGTQTPTPTQGIDGDVSPFLTDENNLPLEDANGCRLSDPDGVVDANDTNVLAQTDVGQFCIPASLGPMVVVQMNAGSPIHGVLLTVQTDELLVTKPRLIPLGLLNGASLLLGNQVTLDLRPVEDLENEQPSELLWHGRGENHVVIGGLTTNGVEGITDLLEVDWVTLTGAIEQPAFTILECQAVDENGRAIPGVTFSVNGEQQCET